MVEHSLQAVPEEPSDPFNVDQLRASGLADIAVERVTLSLSVRRPQRTEFFRVNPDPEYSLDTFVIERDDDMERETYLVHPQFRSELLEELRAVRLFVCINKRGVLFLWPARLPTDGGGGRQWAESALEIAEHAKSCWVKMVGRREAGTYEMYKAVGDFGEPDWPDKSLSDLLRLGFKGDRLIDSVDHPVVRELAGEI